MPYIANVRDMKHLVEFPPFGCKVDIYCDFLLAFLTLFKKGSPLKGKNLLPVDANSFLLELTLKNLDQTSQRFIP